MNSPENLEEYVREIMSKDDLKDFKETSTDDLLMYHHGLGTELRNHYNLWDEEELKKYISEIEHYHPDDLSYMWIVNLHRKLNN